MARDLTELKQFLVRTPFFGGLEETSLDRLLSMLVERVCPAGTCVFREGELGRSMYVVESGELVVSKKGASGNAVRMVRLRRGDFFGDTTLIEMQPRPGTVTVESDAVLLELTNMDLYRLYKDDVKAYVMVLQNINRELCRRLRRAEDKVASVADEMQDEETQIRMTPMRSSGRCSTG